MNGSADLEVRLRKTASNNAITLYALVLSSREAVVSGAGNTLRMEVL